MTKGKRNQKQQGFEVKTFTVPFALEEIKENISISTKTPSKAYKEQIIKQAFKFHSQENIPEAAKYYQYFINQGFKDYRVFSNYGVILKNLGNLKDAELSQRKAIELKPDFAEAHYNLGSILKDLDKLQEAELSTRKAINIKPNFTEAYNNLGSILKDLGKLQDAELSTRKAIQINPNFADAHYNLGSILRDLGKLQEAELSTRKAIEINPIFAQAYNNLGSILKDLGKLQDAELSTRKAIKINPNFAQAHNNLGNILRDFGKLQDAELSQRKAIELKSDFAEAHYNLGTILRELGKLKESEILYLKALELKPDLALAYYYLSLLKYSDKNESWKDQLFSESILNNQSEKDQINIHFARANILHKEKKYKESSKCLLLANNLQLNLKQTNADDLIKKSKILLIESNKKEINQKEITKSPESIFILGMHRSGTTLVESIISMNQEVYALGDTTIFEESFIESKKSNQELNLTELYSRKVNNIINDFKITTNKCTYNYQYSGIIASQIPNAKIIHCFRHPLDNILSLYRTSFSGKDYFSSLIDCARIYLDQEEIMTEYKNRFRSKIYDLNYDLLVTDPNKEIKSLISWLGWKWDDTYLSPHLNQRSVSINSSSSIQVRSLINSKSIDGWKNYKDMLKPAIKIIIQNHRYRDLIC